MQWVSRRWHRWTRNTRCTRIRMPTGCTLCKSTWLPRFVFESEHQYLYLMWQAHPFHRFAIGSLDTLKNVNHKMLSEHFNATYSANLMHIAVYTALKCEDVRDQVNHPSCCQQLQLTRCCVPQVVASFKQFPNREYRRPWVKHYMLSLRTQGTVLHLKPLRCT